MENIYDTNKVITKIELYNNNNYESYFLDFLKTTSIDAGIIILKPTQKDIQEPHSQDEIYYIIEGNGFIEIGKNIHLFHSGMCIFVPSNTPHRFFDIVGKLVALYVFCNHISK